MPVNTRSITCKLLVNGTRRLRGTGVEESSIGNEEVQKQVKRGGSGKHDTTTW